jgi:hypothetical protein
MAYMALAALVLVSAALESIAMRRCRTSLRGWATAAGGVQINSLKRQWLFLGPWQWRSNRWARVFAVTATDAGRPRRGFARVTGGFGGLTADEVEVRWLNDVVSRSIEHRATAP